MSAETDSLLQKMQDAEQKLLDERRLHSERLFRLTGYILGAAFLLTLGLFSFHYRLMNAELRARGTSRGVVARVERALAGIAGSGAAKIFRVNFTTASVNIWWA